MSEEKKELTLEENFTRIEEIIEKLGDADIPLEEAFQAFSEGMHLLGQCNEQIDRVEKQVLKYGVGGRLEEFEDGEESI